MKERGKRILSLLTTVCLSLSMLAGCGNSGNTAETANDTANEADSAAETEKQAEAGGTKDAASGGEKAEITLMASQNWIKDVDKELFKKFEEETGIKVKVSLTPDNEYDTLLGTTLSGGSDAVDLFMHTAGSPMISSGIPDVAVDLSNEAWVSGLEDWAVAANSHDGKLVGFSTWGIDYEGILYNKTFFEENNLEIPTTWEGFMELCDTILGLGVMPLYEGINGTWHTQSWVYGLTPVLYQEKPDFVAYLNESKDNKFADIASFGKGLGQLQQLLSAKEGAEPKYFTNDGQAEDWFGSYISLQEREAVMMFTYSAYAAELAANGSTDEFGMFPVPLLDNQTAVSNGGGISKFISKNSRHIDECKQLLNFLAEKENLETYYSQRTDLVTAAFKDIESVKSTTATEDIMARSVTEPKVMFIKDVLYWDPDVYQYLQGLADESTSVEQFIANVDEYRATMFDTAVE